jgi:hypothetical protein
VSAALKIVGLDTIRGLYVPTPGKNVGFDTILGVSVPGLR